MSNESFLYTGDIQLKIGNRDNSGEPLLPYFPSEGLVKVINQAIFLDRPLLIAGEPGSGKTKVARSVAYELNLKFISWFINSKSTVRDGLYIYDADARLRDAQLSSIPQTRKFLDTSNNENYIQLGPLGQALGSEEKTVILIDEIDKADYDFMNDLIIVLDERRFFIAETSQYVQAIYPPLVFITTNNVKQLPNSFTGRCLFYNLEFPENEILLKIVHWHLPQIDTNLIMKAIQRFSELRMEFGNQGGINELIDWVRILSQYPNDEFLDKLQDKPPFAQYIISAPDLRDKSKNYRPLRVFLCHSSGDKEAVRTLYTKLHIDGIDPWLDEEKLLPGQDWEKVIKKAVKTSDVVIVCLSRTSINKRGFVQKEIKYALDVADEQPEDSVFIIPLILEDCDIPDQLAKWQWVKLFDDNGLEKLMQSLKNRAQELTNELSPE